MWCVMLICAEQQNVANGPGKWFSADCCEGAELSGFILHSFEEVVFQGSARPSAVPRSCRSPPSNLTGPPVACLQRCQVLVAFLGFPWWRDLYLRKQDSVSGGKSLCQNTPTPPPNTHTQASNNCVHTHFNLMRGLWKSRDADCGFIPNEKWGVSFWWWGYHSLPLFKSTSVLAFSRRHFIFRLSATMKTRKLSRVERLWRVSAQFV